MQHVTIGPLYRHKVIVRITHWVNAICILFLLMSGLQIVMAHPSFPWQDEALSVATHKPNVWIDLSGWSPKYFPKQLVQYANTLLKDRVLFGSDYPNIPYPYLHALEAVRRLDLGDDWVRAVCWGNGSALFG